MWDSIFHRERRTFDQRMNGLKEEYESLSRIRHISLYTDIPNERKLSEKGGVLAFYLTLANKMFKKNISRLNQKIERSYGVKLIIQTSLALSYKSRFHIIQIMDLLAANAHEIQISSQKGRFLHCNLCNNI